MHSNTAQNRIDGQRPDAPALAAYGDYRVGVRSIDLLNENQIDIANIDPEQPLPDPLPRYDRPLTVEVWYPAVPDAKGSHILKTYIRDGKTQVELHGQAVVDAPPITGQPAFPLVLISHGYPGNRYLLSHLAENLASKGYIVASIDHTDSTYCTQRAFGSTLINRPLDQIFVLNKMASMSNDSRHFLSALTDAGNTALIGYSMGGYGALITSGASIKTTDIGIPLGSLQTLLTIHSADSDSHKSMPDPRIKTAVAFAPWGQQMGFWDATGLQGIRIPILFIAGSNDAISGYETGIRAIWQGASNIDRALLTFAHAGHNAGAPYPAPIESYAISSHLGYAPWQHYSDSVWDTVRMNNISQHFVTAWLGKQLKGEADKNRYLDLIPDSNQGLYAVNENQARDNHTYWAGFPEGTAQGLKFEWLHAGRN